MKKINLDRDAILSIIQKLKDLQEISLLELTDWMELRATEDRMAYAEDYCECGTLIQYLEEKLSEDE